MFIRIPVLYRSEVSFECPADKQSVEQSTTFTRSQVRATYSGGKKTDNFGWCIQNRTSMSTMSVTHRVCTILT
jgi:hypothetical protein